MLAWYEIGTSEAKTNVMHVSTGWRTSAKILSMQMASLRYHVHADFVFLDGTYPAEGPADSLVERFYPNQPYYEWSD